MLRRREVLATLATGIGLGFVMGMPAWLATVADIAGEGRRAQIMARGDGRGWRVLRDDDQPAPLRAEAAYPLHDPCADADGNVLPADRLHRGGGHYPAGEDKTT